MNNTWTKLRAKRNQLLEQTDKTQLPDFPITTQIRGLYRQYRQYLRDITKLYNDQTVGEAKVKTFEEWKDWKRSGDY